MITELFSLKGRTALVTGGSRGIGRMIAKGYLAAGAKVYIAARKLNTCEAAAAELSKAGGTCVPLTCDLTTAEGAKRLAEAYGKRESKLDILVNNAGSAWGASFAEFPEQGWDKVMLSRPHVCAMACSANPA